MQSSSTAFHWRYAVKKYDPTKKLTGEQLQIVQDSLRFAPSSFGLEAWNVIHVTNPEIRAQLRDAAYGQPQITDASELFILAPKTSIDANYIDTYVKNVAAARGVTFESMEGFRTSVQGAVSMMPPESRAAWLAHQVYIPLGSAIATLAHHEIDATPMEGFDSKQFDEILGLANLGLRAQVILAVGFRASDDSYATVAKYRRPEAEVFIER